MRAESGMSQTPEIEKDLDRIHAAMHAVQSGVAMDQADDPHGESFKHLRVGVNSALVNNAAVAQLLMDKGIFTEAEYFASLANEAEKEKLRYEALLSQRHGANITLG